MKKLILYLLVAINLVIFANAVRYMDSCSPNGITTNSLLYCPSVSNNNTLYQVIGTKGVCTDGRWYCSPQCFKDGDCYNYTNPPSGSLSWYCDMNYPSSPGVCKQSTKCMYDFSCPTSGGNNQVCCALKTITGPKPGYTQYLCDLNSFYCQTTTATVCNNASLSNISYQCQEYRSYTVSSGTWSCTNTWQSTPCPSGRTCSIDTNEPIGSCTNPDTNQLACEAKGYRWAALPFENGKGSCVGDDADETYIVGYSRLGSMASTTQDSVAVCNNRNSTGGLLPGVECVFNGICQNSSTNLASTDNNCNGIDDNCNGYVDEGVVGDSCACKGAITGELTAKPNYGVEIWDEIDNNCNGYVDETTSSAPLDNKCKVGELSQCSNGLGVCKGARALCDRGRLPNCSSSEYGPNYVDNSPLQNGSLDETRCDDLDNDCDGIIDEGCQRTSVLFTSDDGSSLDPRFYGCNLDPFSTSQTPINVWYGLTTKLSYIYSTSIPPYLSPFKKATSMTTAGDIGNIVGACVHKGDYYCDTISIPGKWEWAFKYHPNKAVDSLKNNTQYNLPGDYWPNTYVNTTYAQIPDLNTFKVQNLSPTACCPTSFCNDGVTCVDSEFYVNFTKKPPIFVTYGETGYRCDKYGNWNVVSLTYDYYYNDSGYCTHSSQCYVNSRQPCFDSNQWAILGGKDRMCYNGNWTTRTRFIASTLLNYTVENSINTYTLYCDSLSNSIGTSNFAALEYELNASHNFKKFFFAPSEYCSGTHCVNDFCVLRFNKGREAVILGTSLNRPFNSTAYPLQVAFGFKTNQIASPVGNELKAIFKSPESGTLTYNPGMQVMFYTSDSSMPDFTQSLVNSLIFALRNPITSMMDFVISLYTIESTNVMTKIGDFDRLYFAKRNSRFVTGIQETKVDTTTPQKTINTFISINYTGFNNMDICGAVMRNQKLLAESSTFNCNLTGNSQYVHQIGAPGSFDKYWPDLTAKLRFE